MAIRFSEEQQVFYLTTQQSEYQIKIDQYGHALHSYYGAKVDQDMSYLFSYEDRGFSGNPDVVGKDRTYSLDVLPQEYPVFGMGDYRQPALEIENHDGSYGVELTYDSHEIKMEKYQLEGLPAAYQNPGESVSTLELNLYDAISKIKVQLLYGVFEEKDIITRAVTITNIGSGKVNVLKADSASLDYADKDFDIIHFHGRHNMERQYERLPLKNGTFSIGSHRGTSSHQHNPFIILSDSETTESHGNCYGMMLMYSGNFLATTEKSQYNQVRAGIGIGSRGFRYSLAHGETFTAPEAILSYSANGLEELSHHYHHFIQKNVVRGKFRDQRRPVLINNWEATYFDFTEQKLIDIARDAAGAGIELFVMDDGWFGKRDSDTSGLGDWQVNLEKIPNGLKQLADTVNKEGLKFGIWFEPEMISEDSDMYRKHPEWSINIPGRPGIRSRDQYVLDFTRQDVRDHLVEAITEVLDSANIEYVKWDMNRSLSNVFSESLESHEHGKFYHLYILGLYEVLERLTSAYPDILFEGCSGGGGRFDAGMLFYTPQIWTSDDTDAVERLRIQHGTSFGYPTRTNGSHVSAVPNHQTSRITPLNTRGIVAMSGSFGYELDITKLTQAEKDEVAEQVEMFKSYYDLIHDGLYYRLTNPWENESFTAWQIVSNDKKETLVSLVRTRQYANDPIAIFRLKGLDPKRTYQLDGEEKEYTGAALMASGWPVPQTSQEYQAFTYHFVCKE